MKGKESPVTNHSSSQHTFDKGAKNIQEKESFFDKWSWENWLPTCKKKKNQIPTFHCPQKNQQKIDYGLKY